MANTVNILGDTPKQQWLNAIGIMEFALESNIDNARWYCSNAKTEFCDELCDPEDNEGVESGCAAKRVLKVGADEMRRLVEAVLDD